MGYYCAVVVAFLLGVVLGTLKPQYCPRCKIEREWIDRTVKKFEEKYGKGGNE